MEQHDSLLSIVNKLTLVGTLGLAPEKPDVPGVDESAVTLFRGVEGGGMWTSALVTLGVVKVGVACADAGVAIVGCAGDVVGGVGGVAGVMAVVVGCTGHCKYDCEICENMIHF